MTAANSDMGTKAAAQAIPNLANSRDKRTSGINSCARKTTAVTSTNVPSVLALADAPSKEIEPVEYASQLTPKCTANMMSSSKATVPYREQA